MWFSYLVTPLGPNVRIDRKFIVDLSIKHELIPLRKVCFNVREIVVSNTSEVIDIAKIDPDAADLIKLGVKRFLLGYIG